MPVDDSQGFYTQGHAPWPIPLQSRICHVYALFCQGEGGDGHIKIGHSTRIGERLTALLIGCPVPAKMIAVIEFDMQVQAVRVEKALHRQFAARNTTGEWFRFDFTDKDDKAAFNDGCRKVFAEHAVTENWSKTSVSALRKDARRRQMAGLLHASQAPVTAREQRLRRMQASSRVFIKTE